MAKETAKTLASIKEQLNKSLGDGTIINLDDDPQDVECIPTGSIALDSAIGGGYPLGRIVEIYGPESSGKTTLCIEAMAQVQQLGKIAVMLDAENAFDPKYAEAVGMDLSGDKLIFSQPATGEDVFSIVEAYVGQPEVGIIVIDSIAAMTPRAELEGEFGESKMGLHARLMSQGMRKLVGSIKKSNAIVIFINQTREKIGVMFGNPETTTGGNAMKFYASVRIRTSKRKGGKNKEGEILVDNCKAKIIKNKIAPPHREAEFNIRFGVGIDYIQEVIDYAIAFDIIQKSGSWFAYDGTKIGQGEEKVYNMLADNQELVDEIYEKIQEEL